MPGPVELETDRHPRPEPEDLDGPELPARPARGPAIAADGHTVAPDPKPGDVVGGYVLESLLGKGGAGSVFRARLQGGDVVAIKVLAAAKVKRARVVQRFFDEVRAASSVQHEGLIEIRGFIEEEEPRRLAYVMEYFEGEMLRSMIKREVALDLRLAIQVGVQICDALAALHRAGIVHRDLKPENILISLRPEGGSKVKLLDFGVVKFLPVDRTQGLTAEENKPGTFVGTPRYMAPEQAAGAPVDARADLFSVGVVLFEMITGRCPHEGDSLRDVVLAKLKGAPRITMNPEKEILPQELTDVVDACLQLKPSLRPADAAKVANALREAETVLFAVGRIRAGEGGSAVRDPGPVRELGVHGPRPVDDSGPRPTPPGVRRPGAVTVTPAPGAGGARITASRASAPVGPAVEAAGAAPEARPATATPTAAPEAGPSDPTRRLVMVLLGLIMVAAALVIALAARRFTQPEEAELVTPLGRDAPVEVDFAPGDKPRGTATTTAGGR